MITLLYGNNLLKLSSLVSSNASRRSLISLLESSEENVLITTAGIALAYNNTLAPVGKRIYAGLPYATLACTSAPCP